MSFPFFFHIFFRASNFPFLSLSAWSGLAPTQRSFVFFRCHSNLFWFRVTQEGATRYTGADTLLVVTPFRHHSTYDHLVVWCIVFSVCIIRPSREGATQQSWGLHSPVSIPFHQRLTIPRHFLVIAKLAHSRICYFQHARHFQPRSCT
jgi:hypothetical protein